MRPPPSSGAIKSGGRSIDFPLTRPRKLRRGRPLPRRGEARVSAVSSPLGGEDQGEGCRWLPATTFNHTLRHTGTTAPRRALPRTDLGDTTPEALTGQPAFARARLLPG